MSESRILVTGASGFIGKRCVHALQEQGFGVRAFVLPHEDISALWSDQVETVRGDITDHASVQAAVRDCTGVIHLAAVVGDAGSDALHQRVTVGGTQNLLEATDNHVRTVVISSITYYGSRLGTDVCHEDQAPGKTLGPYSRAKRAQEDITQQAIEAGKNATIVRPGNVYGPASGPWVNDATDLLLQGMPALIGGGQGNAGLVYVDNVVDVILAALTSEKAGGRAYNACDELDVTWRRYFTDLAALAGAKKPGSLPRWVADAGATACEAIWKMTQKTSRPPLTHEALNLIGSHHRVPSQRARDELGVTPKVDYQQGMEAIGAYLKQNKR